MPVFVIIFAVMGLFIVRSFALDPVEEIAWRIFWNNPTPFIQNSASIDMAAHSSMGLKFAAGCVIGAFVGSMFSTSQWTRSKSYYRNNRIKLTRASY